MAPPVDGQSMRDQTVDEGNSVEESIDGADNDEDPNQIFAEERRGWKGYVEWEDCPDKKAKAAKILARHKFPPPPEFQLGLVPDTNPVLEGVRWKLWHKA